MNCGAVKWGALNPCPKCEAGSTGNIPLDIAFSDHYMSHETILNFGAVLSELTSFTNDRTLAAAAFLEYVSREHPEILTVEYPQTTIARLEPLLRQVTVKRFEVKEGYSLTNEPD